MKYSFETKDFRSHFHVSRLVGDWRGRLFRSTLRIKRNRAYEFAGRESLIIDISLFPRHDDATEIQAIGRGVSIRSRDSGIVGLAE